MYGIMSSFRGPASTRIRDPMIVSLYKLGLSSGLQFCLDAGEGASYTSGQTWTDRSGQGNNMYRGTGSGSDSADPTFNGTADANTSSEYFSFDGGDWFSLVAGSNPSFIDNLHQNNAIGTMLTWSWFNTTVGENELGGDIDSGGSGYWYWTVNSNSTFGYGAYDSSDNPELFVTSTGTISEDAWQLLAISIDEANNSHKMQLNGSSETKTGTMGSPSGGSGGKFHIGTHGPTAPRTPIENGGRMANYAMWDKSLSTTELNMIWLETRYKFGV